MTMPAPPPPARPPPVSPAPDRTGLSILIVEDEFYLAMEMQDEIDRAGGVVIGPYADVASGLAALGQMTLDCALIDINPGSGPSFEMADALQTRGVPFMFLTGYDASTIPDRFDGVRCVQKPATVTMLLRTLELIRTG